MGNSANFRPRISVFIRNDAGKPGKIGKYVEDAQEGGGIAQEGSASQAVLWSSRSRSRPGGPPGVFGAL
jgi:hypothetical protein